MDARQASYQYGYTLSPRYNRIFIFTIFNYVSVGLCMGMHTCVQVPTEAGTIRSGAGVIDSSELPYVGARNSVYTLNH